jgi:hypothetical protein
MAIQAQKIKLNMVPGGIIPVVHLSQNDIGRVLQFELYDGVSAASITTGTTVTVEGTKPDRHAFQYDATISGNVVTVNTVQQMVIVPGTVECTLTLTYNSQVIGTALFFMEVERSGLDMNADVSDTELPALMDLARANAERAENAASDADDSAQDAEDAKDAADIAAAIAKSWASYSTDPNIYGNNTNNAHYWSDQAAAKYNDMIAAVGTALNKINSFEALMQLLFGAIYLDTESGDILTTESGDRIIIDY